MFHKKYTNSSAFSRVHQQRIATKVDIKVSHSETWINNYKVTPQETKQRVSANPKTNEEKEL